MIQLFTFDEFTQKTSIDIRQWSPELLAQGKEICFSLGNNIDGKIITRAIRCDSLECELAEISGFYNKNWKSNYTIVHQRVSERKTGTVIDWAYYKLIVFNSVDLLEIKKLLKITKLKAFS